MSEKPDSELAVLLKSIAIRRKTRTPSTEIFLAYLSGELSEAQREALMEWSSGSEDAARTLLDLSKFPTIELHDERLRLTDAEQLEDWDSIQKRLTVEDTTSAMAREGFSEEYEGGARPPKARHRVRKPLYVGLLAAVLAFLVCGLGFRVFELQRLLADATSPHTNVLVKAIDPIGSTQIRNIDDREIIHVPPETDRVVLLLTHVVSAPASILELELFYYTGKSVWKTRKLSSSPEGSFNIEVSRKQLPAGDYEICLSRVEGEKSETLEKYQIRIVYEEQNR